ncbi:copper chaperone PCu(A)C [Vibrio palustris]|uniref:Copper chaperone PCu(A)C n=1 Tax=Vibrio palustris TaxID=1918946 RepID=A0A1R4B6A2_9VIBR|nr:copper chaperone PCu(A)C [Vibrio palustris]SJL84401.1 hypothetical protein VPAL9027_02384 [Vibrio palustris]
MKRFLTLAFTLIASFSAQSKSAEDITVIQPYVTVTKTAQLSAFVYGKIVNNSNKPQVLTSVTTSASTRVEIQNTDSHSKKAVVHKLENLSIPAQSSKVLEPRATRIALLGLVKPLETHKHITLKLHFESGATINVNVPVRLSLKDAMHSPGVIPIPINNKITH